MKIHQLGSGLDRRLVARGVFQFSSIKSDRRKSLSFIFTCLADAFPAVFFPLLPI